MALGSVEQRLVKRSPPERRAWRLARSTAVGERSPPERRAWRLAGRTALRGAVSPRACVALGSVEQRLVKRSPPERRAWRLARSDSGCEERYRRGRAWRLARSNSGW
ncbi:hypothetical protein [Chloroflexus sp.]|uniref:hypothetical protein n=1 Tax=Chloroflexus sp. TaxID=1904827 RepID=UPI00258B52D5|nr:hypothetical protein [Chloroflexus sp.]